MGGDSNGSETGAVLLFDVRGSRGPTRNSGQEV